MDVLSLGFQVKVYVIYVLLVAILAPGFEVDFTEPLCLNVWLKGGIVRLMRYARRSEKAALCLGFHCTS